MFIKKKKQKKQKKPAGKAYAYWMPLSFKTLVTLKKTFNIMLDNCIICEATFVGTLSEFSW